MLTLFVGESFVATSLLSLSSATSLSGAISTDTPPALVLSDSLVVVVIGSSDVSTGPDISDVSVGFEASVVSSGTTIADVSAGPVPSGIKLSLCTNSNLSSISPSSRIQMLMVCVPALGTFIVATPPSRLACDQCQPAGKCCSALAVSRVPLMPI